MKIDSLTSSKQNYLLNSKNNNFKNSNHSILKTNSFDMVSFGNNTPKRGTYEWAINWDKETRQEELDTQLEKAKKSMSWWKRNFTYAVDDLKEANKKTLEKEEIMAMTLVQESARIKNEIDKAQEQKDINDSALKEIDEKIGKLKKWETASKFASAFGTHDEGSLDDKIAGYDAEKQIIRSAYVDEVAMEKAGEEANVPNSILLYGAIGTGKNTFVQAVANETGAQLIELTLEPSEFAKEISEQLREARKRYLETKQRTIILLNEIDIHLEETITNRKNITQMKSWLDNCAKLPTDDFQNRFATTFFFTTNHPTNITDEILYRNEKLGKIIALEPPAEDNIRAIIEFYIAKFDKDGSLLKDETLDYDKIIERMNPNDIKGAFSIDKIKKIVELTFADFNKDIDNEHTFEEHLLNRIDKAKRNILPNRLQEYKEQLENLCEE